MAPLARDVTISVGKGGKVNRDEGAHAMLPDPVHRRSRYEGLHGETLNADSVACNDVCTQRMEPTPSPNRQHPRAWAVSVRRR